MMKQCWEYYPRYRPSFNNLIEQLQGDVKKNFFSVSWYYTNREDDGDDDESDSLIVDDDQSGNTQQLHTPSSHHSSGQHIRDADVDIDLQQIEDDASFSSSHHDHKDLMVDIPMRPPKHNNLLYNQQQLDGDEIGAHSPLLNGHRGLLQSSESDSEAESSLCESSPDMRGGGGAGINFISPHSSKPASSVLSGHTGPPSYNTALDRMAPRDSPTVWSSGGDGSKSNSCNGSANGHLHFGNQLTSAC